MQFPKSSRPCMTAEALGALNLSVLTLAALIVAAFVAGWVDAVVGGGGLIQLPALLIGLPSDTRTGGHLGYEQDLLVLRHRYEFADLRPARSRSTG